MDHNSLSRPAKNDIEPVQNELDLCSGQPSDVLREGVSVYGHDLRDVGHGIL